MKFRLLSLVLSGWLFAPPGLVAQTPRSESVPAVIGTYDRPFGPIHQSRSVVTAKKGMACTSDPRATQAAIEILRRGGSAVDAAIAANAVLGVVEPMSCGIGGDLYSIVWDSRSGSVHGLNASGRSPQGLDRDVFRSKNLKEIPLYGPLSWSVPGCVAGWSDLHQRFGKLPIADVLAPAIHLAEEGFAVSPVIGGYWSRAVSNLKKHDSSAATYLRADGKAPEVGEVFRNPRLAASYRKLASEGWMSYYTGSIADQIVQYSREQGGYFAKEDFTQHTNEWVQPVSTNYRGYDVWQIPPNGQGLSVLQILNVLKRFDIKQMGWGSPQYSHLFIEAKKLAYADRAKFYADMAFEKVPVDALNSDTYAEKQAARIDLQHAAMQVPAGDPKLRDGDTVYLCVVDSDRNCCSLIQSNYHGFGSQMVPGELGFALQNRGNLFSLSADHANRLEPGKRPFHTIIPSMVTTESKPIFVFGVMGGDMQPQGQTQVLVNWIDFGMNIQMAGDASRIRHEGSATPTGTPEEPKGGTVHVESGLPAETIDKLRAMGHNVELSRTSMGGYQGILIDHEKGTLQGATESRNDGLSLGLD
ncbi:Putative gamma-glutamyltransferase YwrD [Pirellula sp. SH-Sr6A]|uniref:gamma-glutamyltransferase n=1 Tax=Pirellula sp. SH-Sr6A TaxID=1632865 RepID=UPI00078EDD62|nr:gamma-glutamyltransferase [Pirellula sp. SH-Sr6A]AMV34309.1 Putative gamma-glutamyltransferase YwrD [Pirellula sp. SH-Sr6A]